VAGEWRLSQKRSILRQLRRALERDHELTGGEGPLQQGAGCRLPPLWSGRLGLAGGTLVVWLCEQVPTYAPGAICGVLMNPPNLSCKGAESTLQ
jgi:hypothetical protein